MSLSQIKQRLPRPTLFWRTFGLISIVLGMSLIAWLQLFRAAEWRPKAERLAWEVASVINLTRAALLNAAGEKRLILLADLARSEGIRVVPAEPNDAMTPWPDMRFAGAFETSLRQLLGAPTRLAAQVDGVSGLWILFEIDEDPYWIRLDPFRLARQNNRNWLGWLGIALVLATAAALLISRFVNRPLANLMQAIDQLSRGAAPTRLRAEGPWELDAVNRRFNRLADELLTLDQDRREALAGISHDIRTPLTRLCLELEMAPIDPGIRASMNEEIQRIDTIVQQFVEFARPMTTQAPAWIHVASVVAAACATYAQHPQGAVISQIRVAPQLQWYGHTTVLYRILLNLLENVRRYGRDAQGQAIATIAVERVDRGIVLRLRDDGPGVPPEQLERLSRPFTRLDSARNQAGGTGLGLAIVARLARQHGGELMLASPAPHGLEVVVQLMDHPHSDKI